MPKWAAYDAKGEYMFDFNVDEDQATRALAFIRKKYPEVEDVEFVSEDEEHPGRGGV